MSVSRLPIITDTTYTDTNGDTWHLREVSPEARRKLTSWELFFHPQPAPGSLTSTPITIATISALPPQSEMSYSVRVVKQSADTFVTYSVQACVLTWPEALRMAVKLYRGFGDAGHVRPSMGLDELKAVYR